MISPSDSRFSKHFLIVTPGITIRDRLRVLVPGDPENYYDERDLVPADLRDSLGRARVIITNYHAFLPRDAKEIRGVSSTTRRILINGKSDPFIETPEAIVSRVLRGFGARPREIVVFNDEAHHCYQDKPQSTRLSVEERDANADARRWFLGSRAVHKKVGIKQIFDLSATPYYLGGSGYNEGFIFPWTVSDFSLMDAIESGIVKIPRLPVDDDAQGATVTYLNLWDHVGPLLPKRSPAKVVSAGELPLPKELQGALESLYRSYVRAFDHWRQQLEPLGEPPPVMIVVCPNTAVSKLVYDWIGGSNRAVDGHDRLRVGQLDLFSNVVDGRLLTRPRTILVDSAQLESGDSMRPDFKAAAAIEIETFKNQYRMSNPGADTDKITDEDLLREVMNTVGKRGKLGEPVRCVVSVAMLTEGWDANTVTHILGIRAFRSQLLCEQVVGRGLRRRSYALNEEGYFEPEYSNVYGIPFAFIPTDKEIAEKPPPPPALEVSAVPGREPFRIDFPRLEGYRVEIPDEELIFDPDTSTTFVVAKDTVPTWADVSGLIGTTERIEQGYDRVRSQEVAYELANLLLGNHYSYDGRDSRPWLFPKLVRIAGQWLATSIEYRDGLTVGSAARIGDI